MYSILQLCNHTNILTSNVPKGGETFSHFVEVINKKGVREQSSKRGMKRGGGGGQVAKVFEEIGEGAFLRGYCEIKFKKNVVKEFLSGS